MVRPAAVLACVLLVAAAVVRVDAQFKACAEAGGAVVYAPTDKEFTAAVNRALYPKPVPAFYADVTTAEQIQAVVVCAKTAGITICPRSGGHSFVGQSSCSGVVIDLYQMKAVKYNSGTDTMTAEVGNTLAEMFYQLVTQSKSKRLVGIGLCPSVGVGGYMLGGGHNPYSGMLGLTCESVLEYEYVGLDGKFLKASKDENQELYWASCGGGGAHFAILHRITMKAHDAAVFNKAVYFRYEWPLQSAGEVIAKWLEYDHEDGMVWFRLEINAGTGLYGYGVCWDSGSVDDCEKRLGKSDFFDTAKDSRHEHVVQAVDSVVDFQMFIGPAGSWGWKVPTTTPEQAFLNMNWDEGGKGVNRLYSSSYWKLNGVIPPAALLQEMAEICSKVDMSVIGFTLCQWNPWIGEQRNLEKVDSHSFAHREYDVFTELIGSAGEKTVTEGMAELKRMEDEIKGLTGKYIGGIYVSYPEFGLSDTDYPYLYWGQNLQRLSNLRAIMDPDQMFEQNQPMPHGKVPCPGDMRVAGTAPALSLAIDAYDLKQMVGMRLAFALPDGCKVKDDAKNAKVTEVEADAPKGYTVYDAETLSPDAFDITVSKDECVPELVAINGVSCSTEFSVLGNTPASETVTSTEDTPDDTDDKAKDGGGTKSGCFPAHATVETRDRGTVHMRELSVGDVVRAADGTFSPIYFFSHSSDAVSREQFVTVRTCTSDAAHEQCALDAVREATLTANHYLLLSSGRLAAAGTLTPGTLLANNAAVMSVRPSLRRAGLYNPHTLAGTILVDGVPASCYTTAVHPALARALLAPLAALFRAAHATPALKGVLALARGRVPGLAGPPLV